MGIAGRIGKRLRRQQVLSDWRRQNDELDRRRQEMAPPAAGSLAPGDLCPCGCGGRMQLVEGVLTAVTLDVADSRGHVRVR